MNGATYHETYQRILALLREHFRKSVGLPPAPGLLESTARWLVEHGVTIASELPAPRPR